MTESRVRWWPLVGVGLLWLAAQIWILGFGDRTGQEKVMATIAAGVMALVLAALWLSLLSRLPWRRRLLGLACLAGLGFLTSQLVVVRGVSGNLVPIVKWRWAADGVEEAQSLGVELRGPLADYPQFLGPDRNATVRGVSLARDWAQSPPRELWRRPIGEGWSAFAVAGRLAITQEQRGDQEVIAAYDLASGAPAWEHADPARYASPIGGTGPRATPTVVGERVFTFGATGRLNALDLATGRRLWTHDIESEFAVTTPDWGRPSSPLVVDDVVVVPVGRAPDASLVAFAAADGAQVWSAGSDAVGYSSPTLVELAGRRQIVIFNQASVAAHEVETGRLLWTFPWSARQPNVSLPVVIGDDRLLVSSGYGAGAKLLRISPDGEALKAEALWESPRLKAKFTNVVVHDGFVYGLDDGVLVCLDPDTGERRWKRGRYGHGQMILVDDLLLLSTEKGEIVLIEPHPDGLRELGRFTAFDGKSWNCPALAGRYLVLRNHLEAALFELPLAPA